MATGPASSAIELRAGREVHRGFRPDVEGLRAVAIVTVLLYHYRLAPFSGGYIGVDVFFVISGFVITRMLLAERDESGRTSVRAFYARRIRRILPAASLTIVATVLSSYLIMGGPAGLAAAHDGWASALLFANVHFAHVANSYLLSSGPTSPLLHFWSLSIEEQFYLVWPALIILTLALASSRWRRGALASVLVAAVAGSFTFSYFATAANPTTAYYSSFARAGELALGAFVAVGGTWWTRAPRKVSLVVGWLALVAIVASASLFNDRTTFPGLAVALPTVATAVLIGAGSATTRGGATSLLGWRPFGRIGAWSFSLYLWHWPIYALSVARLGHLPSWPWRVALLGPTALLAWLSFRFVENPVRRSSLLRASTPKSYVLGGALLTATLVVVLVTGSVATAGPSRAAPRPASNLVALDRALTSAAQSSELGTLVVPLARLASDVPFAGFDRGCLVGFAQPSAMGGRPADCFFGDRTSSRTMVLFGDSNADMWIAAFDALGRADHFRVDLLARASCQLPDLQLWNPASHQPGVACTAFRAAALAEIARLHPFVTVATDYEFGLRWNYADQLVAPAVAASALARTLSSVGSRGSSTVLLGPPPAVMVDPTTCLLAHSSSVNRCNVPVVCLSRAAWTTTPCLFDAATGRTWAMIGRLAAVARSARAKYVSVDPLFCTSRECPAVVEHVVVNYDLRHVSQSYSLYTARVLGQLLVAHGVVLVQPQSGH